MRYYWELNRNHLFLPSTIIELGKVSGYLIVGFKTLKALTEDLFATIDIETLDYCMEVYQQYINCEKLDFFIANKDELKKALERLQRVLFNLKLNLGRLLVIICSLFPKISKFRKDIKKTEGLLKNDLIKQFKKIIRKNGKYSSKIFGKKTFFLERCKYSYFFDGSKYFRIFFSMKIFFY